MTLDPRPILEVLEKHGVDYILVGAVAGILHGSPIMSDDVDIVPALNMKNLSALSEALNELHARLMSHEVPEGIDVKFSGKDLKKWIVEFRFLNLITDHGQLDIIHRPGGTAGYSDLAENAEQLDIGSLTVQVAALEDIIRSKSAVGRQRDLEQLPTLRMVLEKKRASLIRPGVRVLVPLELGDAEGVVVAIRGVGPEATAVVRVDLPSGGQEEREFPVTEIAPQQTR